MIVVDTGPLYAAADADDAHHAACAAVFRDPPDRLVVPVSVVVEASFLIERHLGPAAEASFLASLAPSGVLVEQLEYDDFVRMAELVQTYADMPLGAVDASVVTVAERLQATTILTIDRRHFSIVRPRDETGFIARESACYMAGALLAPETGGVAPMGAASVCALAGVIEAHHIHEAILRGQRSTSRSFCRARLRRC